MEIALLNSCAVLSETDKSKSHSFVRIELKTASTAIPFEKENQLI